MYGKLPYMCVKHNLFWVCHKHNSLPLGPIQPSSPSTKEFRDWGNEDSISVDVYVFVIVRGVDFVVLVSHGGGCGLADTDDEIPSTRSQRYISATNKLFFFFVFDKHLDSFCEYYRPLVTSVIMFSVVSHNYLVMFKEVSI